MTVHQWLINPKRTYAEGVEIYKTIKKHSEFDVYFSQVNDCKHGSSHFNILEREMKRLARLNVQQTVAKNVEQPKILVKPIVAKTTESKEKTSERPKFFNEKMYDFNLLPDGLKKKFKENQELTKEISGQHANMKAVPEGKENDSKRAAFRKKIETLEKKRVRNWESIDEWWNGERLNPPAPKTDTEKALELGKAIEAARKYLARYSDSENPDTIANCKERMAFLKKNGIVWAKPKK